jgi:hypothetical protein
MFFLLASERKSKTESKVFDDGVFASCTNISMSCTFMFIQKGHIQEVTFITHYF